MEAVFLYLLKVNGLLVVFYLAYYLLLSKETFFQSNRWFLLLGIASSFIFPLISFTHIIWIEPEPIIENTNFYTTTIPFQAEPIVEKFNWNKLLFVSYILVSLFFLTKLTIEIFSFFKIIKKGNKLKTENIVLVETNENQNPFSFFNYLVFNKSNFTEEELALILIHEKIHIQQRHSIDVLLMKFLCLLFWANPIIWFYRKAILENLEFIADNQTSLITNKTYEYQKTLLKTIICKNQLSITNQFYQSLIKKRIVMLNTNPSSKKKVWKYSLVLPFLIGFIFLFQIETIAQVKESEEIPESDYAFTSNYSSIITAKSSDKELKELEKTFSDEKSKLTISKVKRNKANEIIEIKLSFDTGKTYNTIFERKSTEPIDDIEIYVDTDANNLKTAGFKEVLKSGDYSKEDLITVEGLGKDTQENEYWSMDNMTKNGKEVVLVINGKVKGPTEKVKLPLNEEIGEMKELSAEDFEKKYNIKADKNKNYYEVQTVKTTADHELPELPIPPAPPAHPYNKLREAPEAPEFPEAPEYPSNPKDEKGIKKFEERMIVFEKKMKNMEPQMQKFEKEMEKYEREMKSLEPDMKAFEKQMEKFEKEMEVYQEKIMEQHKIIHGKRTEKIIERNENRDQLIKDKREAIEAERMALIAQKEAIKNQIEAEKQKLKAELARQKAAESKRME